MPFLSNTYKERQAEIGKKKANAKQPLETKILLFENFSHSLPTLSSKISGIYSKK